MLTPSKRSKLLSSLKSYQKKYLSGRITELDESGTRLMVNEFLTSVLGYSPIDEIKTEYMIKGLYADYVVKTKNVVQFLVEVKSLSLELSHKHLRQALEYGANEGIDWALLTNGRIVELYKIIFAKPIDHKKIFSIDLSDAALLKSNLDHIQYLHKESVTNKGLNNLWSKSCALDPHNVAGIFYTPEVTKFIKRSLFKKYKTKFSDDEILDAIDHIICDAMVMEKIKTFRIQKVKPKTEKKKDNEVTPIVITPDPAEN